MYDFQAYKAAEATRINGIFYGAIFLGGMALYGVDNFAFNISMLMVLSISGAGMGYWYLTDAANNYICQIKQICDDQNRTISIDGLHKYALLGQIITFICAVGAWLMWGVSTFLFFIIKKYDSLPSTIAQYISNKYGIIIPDMLSEVCVVVCIVLFAALSLHIVCFFIKLKSLLKKANSSMMGK